MECGISSPQRSLRLMTPKRWTRASPKTLNTRKAPSDAIGGCLCHAGLLGLGFRLGRFRSRRLGRRGRRGNVLVLELHHAGHELPATVLVEIDGGVSVIDLADRSKSV